MLRVEVIFLSYKVSDILSITMSFSAISVSNFCNVSYFIRKFHYTMQKRFYSTNRAHILRIRLTPTYEKGVTVQ